MSTRPGGVTARRAAASRTLLCVMLVACKPAPREEPHPVASIPDVPAASSPGTATGSGAGDGVSELPPGIHDQTFLVGGTRVRYAILVPEGYSRTAPAPLIVMLHYGGYEGEAPAFYGRGMIEGLAQPAFRSLRAIIIAPDAVVG